MCDIKDTNKGTKQALPPAARNQNPERIACDQIDLKLAEAGWHLQDKDKIDFNARPARPQLRVRRGPAGTK
jgi:hypothetical protein